MDRPTWAPVEIDVSRPANTRLHDAFPAGGPHTTPNIAHHPVPDRPPVPQPRPVPTGGPARPRPDVPRRDRAFLRRAVRLLAGEYGVRQFLDFASGVPDTDPPHETARATHPACRYVYVDADPDVVDRTNALLAGDGNATAVRVDLYHPLRILAEPAARQLVDLAEPVGLLLVGALQLVPDSGEAAAILGQLHDALPSGSYLVLSHPAVEPAGRPRPRSAPGRSPVRRSAADIARLVAGWDLLEPGLVPAAQWRPDRAPTEPADGPTVLCGVARKR